MKALEKLFAEKLLKVKAIKIQPANPFTWASGWKSPIVKLELCRVILEKFGQVDAIAGVATGAIAQGALVAEELNLPFVYVRSSPKDHGIRRDGCEVIGMVASFTYGFDVSVKAFLNAKVELFTLTNYNAVLDAALKTNYIDEEDIPVLQAWREDPAHWTGK